ncbi:ABC transporter permease [Microbacterium soli]|uniref:ABC transporter permease n=1 Tax=Microbacterium soli TaxID=446075 RepID=A0ABP7MXX2_9MICO
MTELRSTPAAPADPSGHGSSRTMRGRWQLLILVALITGLLVVPLFAPYPPNQTGLGPGLQPPGLEHWFGLDAVGRDVFSRTLTGARTSILAATLAVAVGLGIGLPLGLVAGFSGGRIDGILTQAVGILQTIPGLILAMAIVGMTGRSLVNAMIAIGVVFVPRFYRVIRAAALSAAAETYVTASRSMGSPAWRTIMGHVLPAVLSATLVQATVTMAVAVLSEATLSFVGLGVQPPAASLGTLLAESDDYLGLANNLAILPGVCMVGVVLVFTGTAAQMRRVLERREAR